MAYTIHACQPVIGAPIVPGPMLDSGQTRQQVERALQRLGLLRMGEKCPRLPRFGRALVVLTPGLDPYMVRHV